MKCKNYAKCQKDIDPKKDFFFSDKEDNNYCLLCGLREADKRGKEK